MGNELRSTETNVDNDLPHNLKSVFNKLNPQGHEACWPKAYQSTIKSIVNNWQELLHSLIDQDKENNTFMILYANQTSELLCKQNWDHDLWVLLCENMSEIITDEEKYQEVIQIITQSALQEQNRFAERSVTIASQLRVNPWYNLCKNILPLLIHKYQRCRVILLFIAIAAKEQHLLKQANLKEAFHEDEFMSLKSILMTDECWKNLCQVIELLEEKREILRNLSESVENGNLDISNIDNTLNENETRSPAQKDEDGPYGSDLKEREVKQEPGVVASTSNDSENIKIKQEIPSNFSETNEISILGDTNIQKKEPNEKAISPVVKNEKEDVYDSDLKEKGVNQKPTTNLGNIKIKEEYDEFSGTTTATSTTDIKVKQESNVTSSSTGSLTFTDEKDSKVIKKEDNFYKEEKKYDFTLFAPKVEVKTEGSSEDTASMPQGNQMQCTPNDKISQIKEKPSLEKLILDFSFQQLRHSTVTMNEDSINISDDDENCIEPEDNKLEVSQLLSMYQDILTDKSQNVLNPIALLSPLAEQKVAEENKVIENSKQSQRSDYISVTDVTDRSSMIASRQRIPSTSSKHSTQASKAMSSKKFKNQIKRSRSRTNASVKKLFEQLRNESLASITVESPLSTAENTVINLDETVTPKKRKASPNGSKKNKRTRYFNKKVDNDCIPIIQIEETNDSNTPRKPSTVISTSTPIANQNYIPLKKEITKPNNNKKFYEDVTTPQRFYEGLTTPEHLNEAITDLTKEINRDSYLTIDLTNESLNCSGISKAQNTVIDLDTTNDNADCSIISVSNNNLSISGESDVTVLHMSQTKKERQMRNFVKGISKLDATEKGKLLELITQNIFNGCNVVDKNNAGLKIPAVTATRATETAEDTYIKEVILGQAASRNSIGSNIYNPEKDVKHKSGLRMIVIDGSNVAMAHSRGSVFSVKALKICIDYFINRGHVVKAFVPRFRCKYGKSSEPRLLDELERRGLVIYTPSREIQGRMVTSYDDRYIVQCAAEFDGVIVSGDNYRDLLRENPRWRSVIETRVLPFTWVNDMIMFPRDPLGRTGPSLEQFLRHP